MHGVAVIRVEPDASKSSPCDCCSGVAFIANGYVYEDEIPRGVYFLDWTEGHPHRRAYLTVSLGDWGEGTTGEHRSSLGVLFQLSDDGAAGFQLADEPHRESDFLGDFVPRDQAMAIGGLDHFWHIADHIAVDDPRAEAVLDWIRGDRDTAL
jgi:hypothetical protein